MNTRKLISKTAAKKFRARNRRFRNLTIKQQRIKIIRDVIEYLKADKFEATPGIYLRAVGYKKSIEDTDNLHEVLEAAPKCEVCGIGGIFVSAILLKNEFEVKDLLGTGSSNELKRSTSLGRDGMISYLATWFDKRELGDIENAFERNGFWSGHCTSIRAATFGGKYRSNNDRLLAICENMLKNKGKFIPSSRY